MHLIMHKKEILLVLLSFIVSYLLILLFDIGCPLNKIFGIDCAGCGVTRMCLAILRFDFYQAFRFNPFVFILILIFIIYVLYMFVCMILKKNYFKIGFKTIMIIIVLFIGFGILRNINGFEFLRPTIIK